MPFVPILNATQVNVIGSLMGQTYENVWYVQTGDPPTVGELITVNGIFQTAYAGILNVLCDSLAINQIEARYLGSEAGPVTSTFITPAMDGANSAESMPGNVAFVIKLASALPGRQFRGRKYFAGFPVASVVNNTLDSGIADTLVTEITTLINNLFTNGTPLSVVSKTHGTIVPVEFAGYVDLTTDSQRRRLPGRGR